jgi:hypothetical protein
MGRLISRKVINDPKKKEFWKYSAQFLKYPLASSSHQLAHLCKYSELCPAHKAGSSG